MQLDERNSKNVPCNHKVPTKMFMAKCVSKVRTLSGKKTEEVITIMINSTPKNHHE